MMVLKKLVSSARSIRLRSPFLCLVSIFWARVIHGGGEDGAENLDLGVGVVLALLAMPGTLASLSLFDKYGSLLQYLRGEEALDGYVAAVPDEYFFIVLSMTITGLAAVWWWEAVFPGRRDYANLMPLPIAAGTIFLSNLVFIVLLAGLLAFDVNLAVSDRGFRLTEFFRGSLSIRSGERCRGRLCECLQFSFGICHRWDALGISTVQSFSQKFSFCSICTRSAFSRDVCEQLACVTSAVAIA
jgi:hypothetical protein